MGKPTRHDKGFTVIELMIALVIIGVLAVIAIPAYLDYQTKAKQAEAKINLKAIQTSQLAYYSEAQVFSLNIADLEWVPKTKARYRYTIGGDANGSSSPGGSPMNNAPPAAGATEFTAVAWGNLDKDPAIDTWQVNKQGAPYNVYNDVAKELAP